MADVLLAELGVPPGAARESITTRGMDIVRREDEIELVSIAREAFS